jgi:hypothetical protein
VGGCVLVSAFGLVCGLVVADFSGGCVVCLFRIKGGVFLLVWGFGFLFFLRLFVFFVVVVGYGGLEVFSICSYVVYIFCRVLCIFLPLTSSVIWKPIIPSHHKKQPSLLFPAYRAYTEGHIGLVAQFENMLITGATSGIGKVRSQTGCPKGISGAS